MLNKAFNKFDDLSNLTFHSDQGWQYQMYQYHKALKERGITQSMSRKGNCLDNSPMENFFGKMKNEMFYGHEYEFKTLEQLQKAMEKYIDYYNNERKNSGQTERTDSLPGKESVLILGLNCPTKWVHFTITGPSLISLFKNYFLTLTPLLAQFLYVKYFLYFLTLDFFTLTFFTEERYMEFLTPFFVSFVVFLM